MVSCPVAQFLRPGCTDSLAGWLSSLCSERLANNLSAPVGYEASMSTTGPVFHSTAMEIRRTKGSKGERVIFLGLSQGGKDCPDCVLQLSWPFGTDGWGTSGPLCLPATVHYPLAGRHKAPTRLSISSHQDTCDVLLIKRTSMFCFFSVWEVLCNNVPSYAGQKANPWKSTVQTNTGNIIWSLQDKTCFFTLWVTQNNQENHLNNYTGWLPPPVISCSNIPVLHNVPAAHTDTESSTYAPSAENTKRLVRRFFTSGLIT